MRTVHKFGVPFGVSKLPLPEGSKCVHIGAQGGRVVMWVEVTVDAATTDWTLLLVGTGHQLPEDVEYEHLGTVIIEPFVWHVYQVLS